MKKILVVDIETTDFLDKGGYIVEMAAVNLNLKNGKINRVLAHTVLEPGFNFSHKDSWIFRNSDLNIEEVINGPHMNKIIWQDVFEQYPITAWNTSFDLAFLKDRGFRFIELPCPMRESAEFFGLRGPFGPKWAKVQEAWDILFPDKHYVEKHRAFDDAAHEAKIIYELYKKGVYKIE